LTDLQVGISPWTHQREAFEFLRDKRRGMLLMEMGTGKTLVALDLLASWNCWRVLVLCPKSVVPVWPKEVAKHYPNTWKVVPLQKGSVARRAEALEKEVRLAHAVDERVMVVLNYEATIREPMTGTLVDCRWDALVMDEIHRIKAPSGKASLTASRIARRVEERDGVRLGLTGTPMPHNPLDVFAQMRAVDRRVFGSDHAPFTARYANQVDGIKATHSAPAWERVGCHLASVRGTSANELRGMAQSLGVRYDSVVRWGQIALAEERLGQSIRPWLARQIFGGRSLEECAGELEVRRSTLYGWLPEIGFRCYKRLDGHKNLDELHDKLYSVSYRCRAEDVLDLPPFTDQTRHCELGRDGQRAYRQMDEQLRAEVRDGEITAANGLAKLMRLQQITSGYLPIEHGAEKVDTKKRELLKEVLEDAGVSQMIDAPSIVVFCRFHHDLDAVHDVVSELEGVHSCELSGRRDELELFQDGRARVIAVQVQAGGLGVDLSRARYGVYYSYDWSLGNYDQSRARIHRPGQQHPVTYVHLVAARTVDEVILSAVERKANLVDAVIDHMRGE
jgi:SNF2 family DNA or RNA helicase